MLTSEQTDKIFPAFIAAQKEMRDLKKDAENPYFKSAYSSLENVLTAIKPILLQHDIAIIQGSGSVNNGIEIITRLIHSSGQWIETYFPVPLVRQDPQSAGSASSYGRRYGLKAIAALAEVDDDAQASSEPEPKDDRSNDSIKPITDSQLKEINHLFESLKCSAEQVQATCRKFSADRTESTEALMKSEAQRLRGKLRERIKKNAVVE